MFTHFRTVQTFPMMHAETVFIFVLCFASQVAAGPRITDIKYYLYTRQNAGFAEQQFLRLDDEATLKRSNFDGGRPTKFLIHGWLSSLTGGSTTAPWLKDIKDALLEKEDLNVIVVDWGSLAWSPFYYGPSRNARFVGKITGQMIEFLEREGNTTRKMMHLIGHSLGGQVSGVAGRNLDPRPARISGMDTAEFGFNMKNPDDTLDPTDADFVDEIHTLVSYGVKGHADFYPNGGSNPTVLKIREHSHAHRYYLASIRAGGCAFECYTCADYKKFKSGCRNTDGNRMGYYAFKPSVDTQYYLDAEPDNQDVQTLCT